MKQLNKNINEPNPHHSDGILRALSDERSGSPSATATADDRTGDTGTETLQAVSAGISGRDIHRPEIGPIRDFHQLLAGRDGYSLYVPLP